VKIVECTEGRYEVQNMEFGKVYKWCPESVVVECDCGEMLTLTRSETACGWCGVDHAEVVQEELATRQLEDETTHPWRYAGDREEAGIPC
jgi:hypothetical protein